MLEYAINSILTEITELPVSPIFATEIPAIVYTDTPISEGVVKEDQVEIKIINRDYEDALELKKKINKKLNLEYNEPSLVSEGIVLRSELSGGGSIYSDGPQAWELSLIFIIRWRRL